ncbi:unnamed protein product, partial [marine sediment metagenome]
AIVICVGSYGSLRVLYSLELLIYIYVIIIVLDIILPAICIKALMSIMPKN